MKAALVPVMDSSSMLARFRRKVPGSDEVSLDHCGINIDSASPPVSGFPTTRERRAVRRSRNYQHVVHTNSAQRAMLRTKEIARFVSASVKGNHRDPIRISRIFPLYKLKYRRSLSFNRLGFEC